MTGVSGASDALCYAIERARLGAGGLCEEEAPKLACTFERESRSFAGADSRFALHLVSPSKGGSGLSHINYTRCLHLDSFMTT
jgi:hypothetical protein